MTARSDQELLHAAVDGALTDAEAARLRERLAEDAALRDEAGRLKRLAGLMDSLEPSDSPESFSDRVMEAVARSHPEAAPWWGRVRVRVDQLLGRLPGHLQQEKARSAVVRWNTGSAGGGDIVAKKALWACAGLAVVIILGVVYFNGTRTVDQGAQGTIGGAERYRGAQPTNVAVTESDVQKFLQSDTFDRIIKDPHILKLLEDKDTRAALASGEFDALIRGDATSRALQDATTEVLLKQDTRQALIDEDVVAVLSKPSLVQALQGEGVVGAIAKKKLAEALQDEEVAGVLARSAVQEALNRYADAVALKDQVKVQAANAELQVAMNMSRLPQKKRLMVNDPEVLAALTASRSAVRLFTDPTFLNGVRNAKVLNLFMDPDFGAALRTPDAARLFVDADFQVLVKKHPKLFESTDLFQALNSPDVMNLLKADARLHMALNSEAALDLAIKEKAPKKK